MWHMRKKFLWLMMILAVIDVASAQFVSSPDGDWSGNLELGQGRKLKLVIHISSCPSQILMDSPDQGAYGIEAKDIRLSSDSIGFGVPRLMLSYEGRLRNDSIEGTFQQGIARFPLVFERGVKKPRRPQTPEPPFPYTTEEIKIENKSGGSVLAGTLTLPPGCDVYTPVVVMVSGSGLQNRDEELFEHKPFAVIADYLARNGIASFRYDDRGFEQSTGDVTKATTADFASDAAAVVNWLRSERKFNKVGLLGHSEGGQIAYMLAASLLPPDFIISVAGPAIKGTSTIAFQNKMALMKSGFDEGIASDFVVALEKVLNKKLTQTVSRELSDEELKDLYPSYNDNVVTKKLGESIKSVYKEGFENEWMKYFLGYDPAEDMSRINKPAMIIYGELDLQVPASLNAGRARELVKSADVRVYPGLNHLMQHAVAGHVEEYSIIEETISPEVLADIVVFIDSLRPLH